MFLALSRPSSLKAGDPSVEAARDLCLLPSSLPTLLSLLSSRTKLQPQLLALPSTITLGTFYSALA